MKQNLADRLEALGGQREDHRGAILIQFQTISAALRACAEAGSAIACERTIDLIGGNQKAAAEALQEYEDLRRIGVVCTTEGPDRGFTGLVVS